MEEGSLSEACVYCGEEQLACFKFCSNCGRRNSHAIKTENEKDSAFRKNIRLLGVYSLLSIVLLLIGGLSDDTFEILVIWTVCFAIIDLVFSFLQPSVWNLLRFNAIKFKPIVSIIAICITTGILVSYTTGHLNLILFQETQEYMPVFNHLGNPLLYSIIIMAIFPALFEELAFRGFVFNNLKFIGGVKSATWGSTFLFALVHLSLLSLFWLIPFGLLLSYYRKKHSTLIYGMIGHFTHNTVVVLIEYYELF